MHKPNTICKVCRKEYFCCSDSIKIGGWRTAACSPACYQEYMKRIEASRQPVSFNPALPPTGFVSAQHAQTP